MRKWLTETHNGQNFGLIIQPLIKINFKMCNVHNFKNISNIQLGTIIGMNDHTLALTYMTARQEIKDISSERH
jgi:hypothetical protein